jgi:hypothetical protein
MFTDVILQFKREYPTKVNSRLTIAFQISRLFLFLINTCMFECWECSRTTKASLIDNLKRELPHEGPTNVQLYWQHSNYSISRL